MTRFGILSNSDSIPNERLTNSLLSLTHSVAFLFVCLFVCGLAHGQLQSDPVTENKWGQPSFPEVRMSGDIKLASGEPAAGAKLCIVGHRRSEVDATFIADASGHFDVAVRVPPLAIVQLDIRAESSDGAAIAFDRLAWDEKDRVLEEMQIKLQSSRIAEVEVIGPSGSPIDNARVALQLRKQ